MLVARRVYDTGYASAEEIGDILQLLAQHHIPHYETPAGVFGLTPGAIWVTRDADYQAARELIEGYDCARAERVREEYAKDAGGEEKRPLSTRFSNVWRQVSKNSSNVFIYTIIVVFLIIIHWLFFKAISQS